MNFANMANMQRPGGAPMMAPMMAARPGMPPQGMPQVQPNPGMAPNMRATNANYKYTAGVRNVAGSAVPVAPQPVMQTQVPQAAVFIQGMNHVDISVIFKIEKILKGSPYFYPITFTFSENSKYYRKSLLEVMRQNIAG